MDTLVLPVALMCSLGLGGVALSVVAFLQSSSSARLLDRRAKARQQELETAFEAAQETVRGLARQIDQIQGQSLTAPVRCSFNLSTRSQALRMHRRGDTAGQIAAALQIPLQEVELLLRVHNIVLKHLIVSPKQDAVLERASSS